MPRSICMGSGVKCRTDCTESGASNFVRPGCPAGLGKLIATFSSSVGVRDVAGASVGAVYACMAYLLVRELLFKVRMLRRDRDAYYIRNPGLWNRQRNRVRDLLALFRTNIYAKNSLDLFSFGFYRNRGGTRSRNVQLG